MQLQGSFSQAEYAVKKRQTRRDKFLGEMELVVPWARLVARPRPLYPKGERGRPPIGLERMLRLYFVQHWYGLAPRLRGGRRGAGGCAVRQPGVARLCRDRSGGGGGAGRDDGAAFPPLAGAARADQGVVRRSRSDAGGARAVDAPEPAPAKAGGTIVDATILAAPPSTKNKEKARDPQMHQTRKGNQWYFGMKAHIGVDVASEVVHTLTGTAANEADINLMAALLHGGEQAVFADAGYTGADKRPELEERPGREVSWNIAVKRGIIKACPGEGRGPCPKPCGSWPSRWSGRSPRCAPGSSIPSPWSKTGSAIRSCATAAWPRTPRNCIPCLPWPIW